eukprot:5267292-Alexandrium_andersonii.AAC.1
MSASLVGSEMCIRDRLFFLVDLVSSHRNKTEDGGAILELGNLLLRHLETVSYTHLTLPTICSV